MPRPAQRAHLCKQSVALSKTCAQSRLSSCRLQIWHLNMMLGCICRAGCTSHQKPRIAKSTSDGLDSLPGAAVPLPQHHGAARMGGQHHAAGRVKRQCRDGLAISAASLSKDHDSCGTADDTPHGPASVK